MWSLVDLQKGSTNKVANIEIEMATMDSSVQLPRFLPQYWEYRHIAKHTVRLGLCLPYCVDKARQRVLLTMDGLETATVWR